jgi:hypothetical protein
VTREPSGDVHRAAYRLLLGLYPRSYRREVGEAALDAFGDLSRAASREGGLAAVAALWLRTLPRLVVGAVAERVGEVRRAPEGPPYGWAVAAGALVFALYALTLAPTTAFWDTSEYIATAHILGVPHPPGNPSFLVLARAWEVLTAPSGLSVAVRVNLFSAFMSGAAHAFWFLLVHHVLGSFGRGHVFRLVGGGTAVLVSATAFTVWNQSNVNEKVYTVSLLTIALLSWLAIHWRASVDGARRDRLLVLIAFVLALSVGNHLMAFLAAPALLVFIVLVRPRTLWRWHLYPWLVLAGMAGLTVHLFLPLRAALHPIINEGAPLCGSVGSALASILSYGHAGCEALSASLNREQYQKPPVWTRQAPLGSQLVNYLQYFDWQWSRGVQGTQVLFAGLRTPLTALFTGLGVWGALEHHRRDRATFAYLAVLFATLSVALTLYLNFELGYSMPDPGGFVAGREVRERDYFFIVSFSVWGLWAGVGLVSVWSWLSDRLARGRLLPAAPVLALAGLPLVLNYGWADRSYDHAARDWAYNLLESVEPYGVLFTVGDNDTFPLWYLQEVEGIRRDVTVVVMQYLNTPWYAKQVRDLTRPCGDPSEAEAEPTRIVCQREYLPGPRAVYAAATQEVDPGGRAVLALARPVRRPELPIMALDDETIDEVGATYLRLDGDVTVDVGGIQPRLTGGRILEPKHQFALAIVDTAFSDDRPVYWAANHGPPAEIGLEPYLVRHGVAFKLHDGDLRAVGNDGLAQEGITQLPESPLLAGTGRWLDERRSAALADEVYVHRGGLPDWDHWPDHTTTYTPSQYAWTYQALALARWYEGDVDGSDRYAGLALDWMELAQ